MWQQDRIVEARKTVIEWECRRMYGRSCAEVTDGIELQADWMVSMQSAERWIASDRIWWKEIGRFNPLPIVDGTMMSCWGDPTDSASETSVETGGDCDDVSSLAHRDNAEGPGDLISLYLDGTLADCSTCLDGVDNNCDGLTDCEDPACAQCFVGQGFGCQGGKSPCAQGGCSASIDSGDRLYRSLLLISIAIVAFRRRQ